jgi:hypothetical protein
MTSPITASHLLNAQLVRIAHYSDTTSLVNVTLPRPLL